MIQSQRVPIKEVKQALSEMTLEELRQYTLLVSVMLSIVASTVAPNQDSLVLGCVGEDESVAADMDAGQELSLRVHERVAVLIRQNESRN